MGSYTCQCRSGFHLRIDGYTCEGMYVCTYVRVCINIHTYTYTHMYVVCIQDVVYVHASHAFVYT